MKEFTENDYQSLPIERIEEIVRLAGRPTSS